jgi:hypothetical protein
LEKPFAVDDMTSWVKQLTQPEQYGDKRRKPYRILILFGDTLSSDVFFWYDLMYKQIFTVWIVRDRTTG